MPELEPKTSVIVVKYLKLVYGDQTMVLPLEEASDLQRQIARQIPDDDATAK